MPIQRRCAHSGALVFDMTEDEKQAKAAIEKVSELTERLEKMEAMFNKKNGGALNAAKN